MRILHILPTVSPVFGGPIEGVIKSSQVDGGRHVRNIASLDLPGDPWVKNCALPVIPLGKHSYSVNLNKSLLSRYGYSPYLVPWLKAHVRDYDAVVLNGLWNYSSFAARLALQKVRVPFFVFPHGMLDPWFAKAYPAKHMVKQLLWLWSEGWLLNNANGVLFTTEDEKDLARHVFKPYHIKEYVVGYGTSDVPPATQVQRDAFYAAAPQLRGKTFLLYLSRIHPKKGCDLLIEAFARISRAHPELHLAMVGPDQIGLRKSLEQQAVRAGASDRIHWPGMLQGDAKWGAFREAEAFVLPSHQENFGIVVAEALASSLPVLISNKVNIWREVVKYDAGLVAPDDVEGTQSLLQKFLALSDEERARMRQAARMCFLQNFDVTHTAESLMETIERNIGVSHAS